MPCFRADISRVLIAFSRWSNSSESCGSDLQVHPAGQHPVYGHVEVGTRGLESSGTIIVDTTAIGALDLVDELLHLLRLCSLLERLRLSHRRVRLSLCLRSDGGRCSLRGNSPRRASLLLRASRKHYERHTCSHHCPLPKPAQSVHPLVCPIDSFVSPVRPRLSYEPLF